MGSNKGREEAMRKRKLILVGIVVIVLLTGAALAASQYQLDRSVVSGGGGDRSSTNYALHDVVGEAVVGASESSSYKMSAGFLAPPESQGICGDATGNGKVTVSDGRRIFLHILDPETYPISCPWAADVTGNGKITVSDGRRIFLHILDPDTYPLECQ
jgi:hypothetical protein